MSLPFSISFLRECLLRAPIDRHYRLKQPVEVVEAEEVVLPVAEEVVERPVPLLVEVEEEKQALVDEPRRVQERRASMALCSENSSG